MIIEPTLSKVTFTKGAVTYGSHGFTAPHIVLCACLELFSQGCVTEVCSMSQDMTLGCKEINCISLKS